MIHLQAMIELLTGGQRKAVANFMVVIEYLCHGLKTGKKDGLAH